MNFTGTSDHWKLLSRCGFLQPRNSPTMKSARVVQYFTSDTVRSGPPREGQWPGAYGLQEPPCRGPWASGGLVLSQWRPVSLSYIWVLGQTQTSWKWRSFFWSSPNFWVKVDLSRNSPEVKIVCHWSFPELFVALSPSPGLHLASGGPVSGDRRINALQQLTATTTI